MSSNAWFVVDKEGLAGILERRGKSFAVLELIQNAWDQRTTHVSVELEPIAGVPRARLVVTDDDPDGFADIRHAFTLFADSRKKDDPCKRGRFNIGQKLVLALCDEASIRTTTAHVMFERNGRRRRGTSLTRCGSVFSGILRMTRAELDEALASVATLIPPDGVITFVNGVELTRRTPLRTFYVPDLMTERVDVEGRFLRTRRLAVVKVFEPLPGEVPTLYELGIPVVETGDRWHVDVGQKVPLNVDRDNVPPSYLKHLRTMVANEMGAHLSPEDASSTWVKEAMQDSRVEPDTVRRVLDLRFGERRVSFDPSDPEANARAVAAGYVVVAGGSMSAAEWSNVRSAGAIFPAGQVTPGKHLLVGSDGVEIKVVPEDRWTGHQREVAWVARQLGVELIGVEPQVRIVSDLRYNADATWEAVGHMLTFNVARLGHAFFSEPRGPRVIALLLHEFAHHHEGNHLSDKFADAIAEMGSKLPEIAVRRPNLFGLPS